jgi:hypothetical protein
MTGLEFEQNIFVFYLVDHVGEVHVLDLHDIALHPQKPINKSLADLEVGLADSGQAGVGLADFKVGLADSE